MNNSPHGQFMVLATVGLVMLCLLGSYIFLVPQSEAPVLTALDTTADIATTTNPVAASSTRGVFIQPPSTGSFVFERRPQSSVTFTFRNSEQNAIRDLYVFSRGKGEAEPVSLISFVENTFYLVNNDGQLQIINSIYQPEIVPLLLEPGQYISDYIVLTDLIYYVAGPYCDYYMGECTSTLRVYDRESESTETLATNIESGKIAGFKEGDQGSLYLAQYFGDGGCYSAQYEVFILASKKLTADKTFSGCEGEPGHDEEFASFKAFADAMRPNREAAESVYFNGTSFQDDLSVKDVSAELIQIYR